MLTIEALVFVTILVATLAVLRRPSEQEVVLTRLEAIRVMHLPREAALATPFSRRVLQSFAASVWQLLRRFVPAGSVPLVQANLAMAGRRYDDALLWIALKWLRAGILAVAALWYATSRGLPPVMVLTLGGAGAAVGYLWPELTLRRAIRRRQTQITKEIPEALDRLTVAVEAGLGLDQALDVVSAHTSGPLSKEIRMYLDEVALGNDRQEALRAIGIRTGVEEMKAILTSFIQAAQFGVSIGSVLRVQSDEARHRHRHRIEEQAQKTPVKLLFPLIFLILPSLFVVAAGPGFLSMFKQFNPTGTPGRVAPPPLPGR